MITLDGRVALITGGASGIGAATAAQMAAVGASVVVADINRDRAEAFAEELRDKGYRAAACVADVGSEDDVARMVQHTVDEFGSIDIVHNNAAYLNTDAHVGDGPIHEGDMTLLHRVLGVNLIGQFMVVKHAVPHMLRNRRGVFIATASTAGELGMINRPMYGISKAGVIALTKNIATQYGRYGIRAVGISPGLVLTETAVKSNPGYIDLIRRQTLTPYVGEPADIAAAATFLASDAARFITAVTIPVDGGFGAHYPTYGDQVAEQDGA